MKSEQCTHIWYISLNKYVFHIANISHTANISYRHTDQHFVHIHNNIYAKAASHIISKYVPEQTCLLNWVYMPNVWWAYIGHTCICVMCQIWSHGHQPCNQSAVHKWCHANVTDDNEINARNINATICWLHGMPLAIGPYQPKIKSEHLILVKVPSVNPASVT